MNLIQDRKTRIREDFKQSFGEDYEISEINAAADVFAGVSFLLDSRIDQVSKWVVPNPEMPPEILEKFAGVYDVPRRSPDFSRGDIVVVSNRELQLSSGIRLQGPNSQIYLVARSIELSAGDNIVPVISQEKGSATVLTSGALSFIATIEGVRSDAGLVPPGINGGRDAGTNIELYQDLIRKIQSSSQVGDDDDWNDWVNTPNYVYRGYVYPRWAGPGFIGVNFTVRDDGGNLSLPSNETKDLFLDYVNTKRILGQNIVYANLKITNFKVNISSPQTKIPNQSDLKNELALYFSANLVPQGSFSPEGKDGQIKVNEVVNIIVLVTGIIDFSVSYSTSINSLEKGELLNFTGVTWNYQ